NEYQEIGAGLGARCGRGEDFGDGNERDIGYDEVGGLGNVGGLEFAGVALDGDHTRILLKLPGELSGVDVHGVDFRGVLLEQAVGEAAGGSADVEANEASWI